MTDAEDAEVPVHEGPDPHDWPAVAPRMWGLVLDIEYLDRIIAVLDGPVEPESAAVHGEARAFLDKSRRDQRADLAAMILHAYRVDPPGEKQELPTEAVGGFSGDSDRPGDRDHV
jgi:hypothetical protein